jgi:hypothetical protein
VSARVDPGAAREVAAAYLDAPRPDRRPDPLVEAAYAQLVDESDLLYRWITDPDHPDHVDVAFTACAGPYGSAGELIESVRRHRRLEVVTVAADPDRARHPLLGCEAGGAYDRLRAVHDILGHARLGLGFDRDGEFAVWRSQARHHGPLARRALATELHAQHSVLWTTGELAEPKAVLLDPRVVRRSAAAAPTPAPRPDHRPDPRPNHPPTPTEGSS